MTTIQGAPKTFRSAPPPGTNTSSLAAPPPPKGKGFSDVDGFEGAKAKGPSGVGGTKPPAPLTDNYKSMTETIKANGKAGTDMLVDHEVEKLIHNDQKPQSAEERKARADFLKAARNAGYDVKGAPNWDGH